MDGFSLQTVRRTNRQFQIVDRTQQDRIKLRLLFLLLGHADITQVHEGFQLLSQNSSCATDRFFNTSEPFASVVSSWASPMGDYIVSVTTQASPASFTSVVTAISIFWPPRSIVSL